MTVVDDAARRAIHARMVALRDAGLSLSGIAARLNASGVQAIRGGRWYAATVRLWLQNTFQDNSTRNTDARTHATSIAARIDADRARLP